MSQKFKPILFSTPMVQAILDGRKTQTRRIIKPQPDGDGLHNHTDYPMSLDSDLKGWWGTTADSGWTRSYGMPFSKGDILWVRETWTYSDELDNPYWHKEDWIREHKPEFWNQLDGEWRPSIFMPKEACRIFLEITNVRVQQIRDISAGDAIAEGIERIAPDKYEFKNYWLENGNPQTMPQSMRQPTLGPVSSFRSLWSVINPKNAWPTNPWVWVISFKQVERPDNF